MECRESFEKVEEAFASCLVVDKKKDGIYNWVWALPYSGLILVIWNLIYYLHKLLAFELIRFLCTSIDLVGTLYAIIT